MKRIHPQIIWGGIIVVIVLLVVLVPGRTKHDTDIQKREHFVALSGAVIDVSESTPVAGVDLTVGDTSTRTGETGQFVFSSVSTSEGVRLTHPELLRAVAFLPTTRKQEQVQDILFDVDLYNTLISAITFEADGNIDEVYTYFAPVFREAISLETFRTTSERIFFEKDVNDQELVVQRIKKIFDYHAKDIDQRFDEVITFEVLNKDISRFYYLLYDPDESSWFLIT